MPHDTGFGTDPKHWPKIPPPAAIGLARFLLEFKAVPLNRETTGP